MFHPLEEIAWQRVGCVNIYLTSTRAMAFIIAGHVRHHAAVLSSRYGIEIVA